MSTQKKSTNPTQELQEALVHALASTDHQISSAWLYDQRGSALFEEITELPSYYPTRTEIGILEDNLAPIAKTIGSDCLVVELGSGSSRKTVRLINALSRPAGYVPVDISADYLHEAVAGLAAQIKGVPVVPLVADFTTAFPLPPSLPAHSTRLGFFPGSTIGNLSATGAQALLQHCHKLLGPDGMFLVGIDLDKSPDVLIPAYDDPEGVTAAFNRNLLVRMNRELGLAIDVDAFEHEARYFADPARIEMHLVATADQAIEVADQTYTLIKGESFHTETSHKYTVEGFAKLAERAGWQLADQWLDSENRFAVLLFSAIKR